MKEETQALSKQDNSQPARDCLSIWGPSALMGLLEARVSRAARCLLAASGTCSIPGACAYRGVPPALGGPQDVGHLNYGVPFV